VRDVIARNRLLLAITLALALILGVVAALALKSWWVLGIALAAHGALSLLVIGYSLRLAADEPDPDPGVEERLEEEAETVEASRS
jgi:membrane protein implicated in regulation of membrane protease activity